MNTRIAQVRKSVGLTQGDFGERIGGLTRNYVWMIEKGERVPSDRTISDICREFNVSESWLRTGEGEMFAKRTREEELGDFIADVLKDEPDSFRRRIVAILAKLTPSDWAAIERRGKEILAELEEEKKKPAP